MNRYATYFIAIFACYCVQPVAVSAQIYDFSSIKILCIGYSITQGGNLKEEYTYRLPLFRLIQQKGVRVDFIGARKSGLNESFSWPADFDLDHEGFYGATTSAVNQALKVDLPALPAPDIAIIDLGANDEGKNAEVAVVKPLTEIIFQLRARNPRIKILIVQIPGIFKNFGIHFQTWRMARNLGQTTSPVVTIPLYWGWDTESDTFDRAHPNVKGQQKMAAAIFAVLESMLDSK